MIKAEMLAHSVSEAGAEAITMRVTMPRIVLAEFNTHRKLSKNTSSSRAIPIKKMIQHVRDNMFTPVWWGKNQSGMQAAEELTGIHLKIAKKAWRLIGLGACTAATLMNKIGVHKQITNRLIENFSYVTVIFTGSDIDNFLWLRNHDDAQPEIHEVARAIVKAHRESTPRLLAKDEWHLPLVKDEERESLDLATQIILSVARCASTSYQTVDGKMLTIERAKDIFLKLSDSDVLHASPFEHQLTPDSLVEVDVRRKGSRKFTTQVVWENPQLHGNTIGWMQNRKMQPKESYASDSPHFLKV